MEDHSVLTNNQHTSTLYLHKLYAGLFGFTYGTGLNYMALRHNLKLGKKDYSYHSVFKKMISSTPNKKITVIAGVGGGLIGYILM